DEPFTRIAPFYDRLLDDLPYAAWVDYLELLGGQWGASGGPLLDLACGTGSVGLELARRGCRVVGADRSASMLAEGRRKARAARLPVLFVRQDMRALGLAAAFDRVVCLFDSLNYLLEPAGLAAAFRGVAASLRPGGLFIFDLNTERALADDLFTRDEPNAEVPHRWRSRYDAATRIATVDLEFRLPRAHRPREVRAAAEAAGLDTLAVYEAYTLELPRPGCDRVFYVCRTAPRARGGGLP
ncbi:MAG: class I SAM-dependent methyltransferase, partial [Armatimonadetes bacterium]|nr:class I SAM-dependent methyltransferase [Armatimonadota bacterium]